MDALVFADRSYAQKVELKVSYRWAIPINRLTGSLAIFTAIQAIRCLRNWTRLCVSTPSRSSTGIGEKRRARRNGKLGSGGCRRKADDPTTTN
jgi:hypothetical protein